MLVLLRAVLVPSVCSITVASSLTITALMAAPPLPSVARLAEIKARAEAATPGPWEFDYKSYYEIAVYDGDENRIGVCSLGNMLPEDQANGWFIQRARKDIPALVAEVERLRAALEKIEKAPRSLITYSDLQRLAEDALDGDK